MVSEDRRASWLDLIGYPPTVFFRNYFLKRGILDGIPGLVVSFMNSYYVFLKYAKLWADQHSNKGAADT